MPFTFHLDIVSAEEEIFSGTVDMLVANGELGELGVAPGHAPLLTSLKPGMVKVTKHGGDEEFFYVSGGMLEIQPHVVTILSDTAIRAKDVDEAAAQEAIREAEKAMQDQSSSIDHSRAAAQIAEATAQLRTLQAIRRKMGK